LEAIMAALIIVTAITGILLGGFVAICLGIRRLDKHGSLQQAPASLRHLTGAHASRWDSERH
jgi:hypothetical protein